MAIEEAVEQKAQDAVFRIVETGARVTLSVSKTLALTLVRSGWHLAGKGAETIREHLSTGEVSERKLQSLGQDVHMIELREDSLKAVSASLRKAGITYHVERNADGYWLHFQGKDVDHVRHAVNRAFEKIGLTYDEDGLKPTMDQVPAAPAGQVHDGQAAPMTDADRDGDSPEFTMRFETSEWDPDGRAVGDGLTDLGVPFTQEQTGEWEQSSTFGEEHAPAVKAFIDRQDPSSSMSVEPFGRERVPNYEQLEKTAAKSRPTPTTPARGDDGPGRPEPKNTATTKKSRSDFLKELRRRTGEKIAASHARTPKITHDRGHSHGNR